MQLQVWWGEGGAGSIGRSSKQLFGYYWVFNWKIIMILWWFLPYINMNQPQVYICPLPLETSSHSPPYPTPVGCHRASALSYLCYLANSHWLSILHMILYMIQCYSLISSHPYLFWPQRYKTRYQLQEKKPKKHKHMEAKLHTSK